MIYFVGLAMLLLFATLVYPPLGRNIGERARRFEKKRDAFWANALSPKRESPPSQPDAAPLEFGKRKTIEEPRRPAQAPIGQLFPKEVFEGKTGEFLRDAGFAPDDPRNQAVNVQPVSVLLAEDLKHLRDVTSAVNKVAKGFELVPCHLLPTGLWRGRHAEWLRQHLDLSPCRPWNTIFLPSNEVGANELGLPVAPPQPTEPDEQTLAMIAIIHENYAGMDPPEGQAVKMMLHAIRGNFPKMFPPDTADFSERVRQARADVRSLAFGIGGISEVLTKEVIIAAQTKFLHLPEQQLIA